MIRFNKDEDVATFLVRITTLTPKEFIGLTKVLDVSNSVVDPETKKFRLRDADEILEECVVNFRKLRHKERKIILKAMKK